MNQEDIVKLISPSAVLERIAEAIPADYRENKRWPRRMEPRA